MRVRSTRGCCTSRGDGPMNATPSRISCASISSTTFAPPASTTLHSTFGKSLRKVCKNGAMSRSIVHGVAPILKFPSRPPRSCLAVSNNELSLCTKSVQCLRRASPASESLTPRPTRSNRAIPSSVSIRWTWRDKADWEMLRCVAATVMLLVLAISRTALTYRASIHALYASTRTTRVLMLHHQRFRPVEREHDGTIRGGTGRLRVGRSLARPSSPRICSVHRLGARRRVTKQLEDHTRDRRSRAEHGPIEGSWVQTDEEG